MSEIRPIPPDIVALINAIWGDDMVIEVIDVAQPHHGGRSFREMIAAGDERLVREHLGQIADGAYS